MPVRIGGSGKRKYAGGELYKYRTISDTCRAQGLPETFCSSFPFTAEGKRGVIGNGVPMAMGRAVARAVKRALEGGTR